MIDRSDDPSLAARLDAAMDRAIADRRIVGTVVLVARGGELVYRRAAGLADREEDRPMREDAIFLLASVTKPFVAAAAMRLVERGLVGLDEPVTTWLPDFRPRTVEGDTPVITVDHLLTHTAGLSYDFMEPADGPYRRLGVSNGFDRPGPGLDENLRRIAAAPLIGVPGTGWAYSLSIDVLGAVIEKAAGCDLPEAVRRLVGEPLGTTDTDFAVTDPARLVAHYGDGDPEPVRMGEEQVVLFNDAPVTFAPGRLFDPRAYPSGGAGMAGTAGDVLRLLEALRAGGSLLEDATLRQMTALRVGPQAQTQGPGWGFGYAGAILVDPAATGTPHAPGTIQWGGAYGHNWFVDPAAGLCVVALTNTAFEGMAGAYTTDIRDAVYGIEA